MTAGTGTDERWLLEWYLGPVQGFVTASRRTRDLWGGSYLLSLLVAEAIAAANRPDSDFEVPAPDVVGTDPLVAARREARRGQGVSQELPPTASLPNHVRLRAPRKEARAVAEAMRDAVQQLWEDLAGKVWQRYVSQAAPAGNGTKAIWDRQVSAFWEVMWVAGEAPDRGQVGLLERRKLWRSHLLPDEPGDRCMVMPEWQELSGFVRARGKGEHQQQEAFWENVRQQTGDLDVRPDERLSAPAMVKRLWPAVAEDVVKTAPDAQHWPSTWHFAAAPLLASFGKDDPAPKEYHQTVKRLLPGYGRRRTVPLAGMERHALWGIEPELLHRSGVRATKGQLLDEAGYEQLEEAYQALCRAARGAPSPYFAVVLADGDRLGQLVSNRGTARVGPGLDRFAEQARGIAGHHRAVVVYAGGDDVLAFAPVSAGLGLADALAKSYEKELGAAGAPEATMSAAVVFGHARSPLSEALSLARGLLGTEAKDANGRASVAVAVARGAAHEAQWACAFDPGPKGSARAVERLSGLVEAWRPGSRKLSSSALYRVADITRRFLGTGQEGSPDWAGRPEVRSATGAGRVAGEDGAAKARGVLRSLVANELARTEQVTGQGVGPAEAWQLADELLWCMGRHWGPDRAEPPGPNVGGAPPADGDRGAPAGYQLGVLDLVHFLSTDGGAEA